MTMFRLSALFFATFCRVALAFDILPEYQGLSETDASKFERPSDLDAEYQSLLNAYAVPPGWDVAWSESSRAMDFSTGSLSNKHFLFYSRLKLEAQWLESLRLRDREVDQSGHIIELIQRLSPWVGVSLYGEPSHYKRQNRLGVALELSGVNSLSRIYYTANGISRAEHNDQQDYFTSRASPDSMGYTGELRREGLRMRLGFRYDQRVTWVRPQENRLFEFSKKLAFAEVLREPSVGEAYGLRLQWDATFKSQMPESSLSLVGAESWNVQRLAGKIFYHLGSAEELRAYQVELMYVRRQWRNQAGERVEHLNTLPSVAMLWRGQRRGGEFDHLKVGYEMTLFNTFGDLQLTPARQKHDSVENRLATGYEFSFRSKAKLLLALNFDLDEFSPVPTFEGGNGQFRAEF